jgi:hypothetical protein
MLLPWVGGSCGTGGMRGRRSVLSAVSVLSLWEETRATFLALQLDVLHCPVSR